MPKQPASSKPRARRRKYLVNPRMQLGMALRLLVPVAGVAGLSTATVLLFMGKDESAAMNATELRQFLLVANGIYFVLQAGILVVASLVLSHRLAGPAEVVKDALAGMLEGDDSRRLRLRDYDHLKDVATHVAALRGRLLAERAELESSLGDLADRLAEGNVAEATRIVADLRTPRASVIEEAPAVVRQAGLPTAATAV